MKRMFERLTRDVSGGKALSEALAEHKRVFNALYLSMIRVGETGGILEKTSTQLAMILAREEKIKSNMKTAAAYPIFLLCLGMASAVLVVTVMLPKILGHRRHGCRGDAPADPDPAGGQSFHAESLHEHRRLDRPGRPRRGLCGIASDGREPRAECSGTPSG